MLPEHINDTEMLYRSVPNIEGYWNPETGRVSSAVFKGSSGISVDRDGGRDETAIIAALEMRFTEAAGIVVIHAGACRACGTHPVALPEHDNPYHAEIQVVSLNCLDGIDVCWNCWIGHQEAPTALAAIEQYRGGAVQIRLWGGSSQFPKQPFGD